MAKKIESETATADREIVISREFDAPRELVWMAWTHPVHVMNWWGPHGFTTLIKEMDVRPGGVWEHVMRGPDGTEYPNRSVFKEVVEPERIVYSNEGGRKGAPEIHFESTWTFEDLGGGRTRLTLRHVFPTAEARDRVVREYGAIEGGRQTLERLAGHLPVLTTLKRELILTRVFDAPPEDVFEAWTDPARMRRWWGPDQWTNPVCELDVRAGGKWRIVMRGPDGTEHECGGVYQEVAAPGRLVFTNNVVAPGGKLIMDGLTTVTFTAQGARTLMTLQTRNAGHTPETAFMLAGMEMGWSQSLVRLAAELSRPSG